MAIKYLRCLDGKEPEMGIWTVGATAVKAGDPCKKGASAHLLIPITAAADVVVGMAMHDAAIGASVSIIYATESTVFQIPCSAAKKYVASADKYTQCDFDTFTSGAMSIDPATDTAHSVFTLDLASGSPDNTNANQCQCIFNLRLLGK